MNIKDKLTIVIPSFNEENYIERTLTNLANQNNITGTRVIIADGFSRDMTRAKIINLKHNLKDRLNIELVNGGKVAYARNFGLSLVKTKYVLFMDADTVLMDNNVIDDTIKDVYHNKLELLTCRVKSVGKDIRTNLSFKLFNLIPPNAQTLQFQFNVIKLNLIGPRILLYEYFLLKKIGDSIMVSQFCIFFI